MLEKQLKRESDNGNFKFIACFSYSVDLIVTFYFAWMITMSKFS
jgi:hypothetical protein